MAETGPTRRELVEEVWPDKILFASMLLLVTGLLGLLHGLFFLFLDPVVGGDLPGILQVWPPGVLIVLSALEAVAAHQALDRQQTRWASVAAVLGLVSLNLFGLGSILSFVAVGFIMLARLEGEDAVAAADRVPADVWPDKALAASTLLVVAGVLTIGWGFANAGRAIAFQGYMDQQLFGFLCLGLGALALAGGYKVYRQEAPWLGALGAVGAVLGLALYVLGPILGLGALALIWAAKREDEFTDSPGRGAAGAG